MLKLFSWKLFRITQTNFKNFDQNYKLDRGQSSIFFNS